MNTDITAARLRELVIYDPNAGIFTWVGGSNPQRPAGERAGRLIRRTGYRRLGVDGKQYQEHRLAWLYMTGTWPLDQIDHINGQPADNRWANLREASDAQNRQNQKIRSDNTSGHQGVTWCRQAGKWQAQIRVAGRTKFLGYFDCVKRAAAAYVAAKPIFHPFSPRPRDSTC